MIDYQVLRSCRKTLSLQVKQGLVYVRAPHHVDEKFIHLFIQEKSAWLRSKITEQSRTADLCCNFTQGSILFLFGRLVTLNIIYADSHKQTKIKENVYLTEVKAEQQILTIVLPARSKHKNYNESQLAILVKKQLECYFKKQAHQIILPKVAYYAELTQLTPTAIKIRQYRARWGSCNNKGELSFNYLLMMLPIEVIDYVIVHELCHLQHLNHSHCFWQLVGKYFPDYVTAKEWVKTHQSALYWQLPV